MFLGQRAAIYRHDLNSYSEIGSSHLSLRFGAVFCSQTWGKASWIADFAGGAGWTPPRPSCEKAGTDSGTAVAQRLQPREFRKLPHGKTRKGRSEKCGGAQLALPLMLALTLCGHGAVHGTSVLVQIFGGLFAVLGSRD